MENHKGIIDKVKFNENGLIPAVVQDINNGQVLMLAYMNSLALEKTLKSGKAHFWSRSRQKLWLKGETSGNFQFIEEIKIDCDQDTLLLKVNPAGPACHTGHKSCFYREIKDYKLNENINDDFANRNDFLQTLTEIIYSRKDNPPSGSYTAYLFEEGIDKICKKIGEEATEVVIGAKNDDRDEIIYESADLLYHLLVLLAWYNLKPADIIDELAERHK